MHLHTAILIILSIFILFWLFMSCFFLEERGREKKDVDSVVSNLDQRKSRGRSLAIRDTWP